MRLSYGYVRVSTQKQDISLAAQSEKIRAMAVVQNVRLSEVIVDSAESAKSLERPGVQRLLALIESRQVERVFIAKLDRITRSVKDLAELMDLLNRRGVSLVSVAESLDTTSPAGRLVANIMISVSQWEREAIGSRTRDALQHKKSKGERVGTIPYGYRLCDDGKHLRPDSAEQKVLSQIRALRAKGRTLRAIADHLNMHAFTTRRGSAWRHAYVDGVLRNASA